MQNVVKTQKRKCKYIIIHIRKNVIKKLQIYKSHKIKPYSHGLWLLLLLHHTILGSDALHNAENQWIWKHIRNPHCTLHFGSVVVNDLEWVWRLSDPLLLNNNLLVERDMSCIVRNGRRCDHNRMRYFVEPFHVPLWMLPHLILRDRMTHLLLAKDMDNKLHGGHNYHLWRNLRNRRRRYVNNLDIAVLPQNPLRQVTAHLGLVGHNQSRVPAYVMKRRKVSSSLVRPPDDTSMLHQINCGSVVSNIRKALGRFPSTHKRVSTQVIWIKLPRNELPEVRQNPSLQTQRDKFISAQVSLKNYTFTIH